MTLLEVGYTTCRIRGENQGSPIVCATGLFRSSPLSATPDSSGGVVCNHKKRSVQVLERGLTAGRKQRDVRSN